MNNPVHHDIIFMLDLEQDTVLPDAQTVLRAEMGQPLHITREVINQPLKRIGNPRCILLLQTPQILRRLRLESDCVLHGANVTSSKCGLQPPGRTLRLNVMIVTGDTVGAGGGSSAVPEPGTLVLLVLGATGLAALRSREG
jgi:hypothetical protein